MGRTQQLQSNLTKPTPEKWELHNAFESLPKACEAMSNASRYVYRHFPDQDISKFHRALEHARLLREWLHDQAKCSSVPRTLESWKKNNEQAAWVEFGWCAAGTTAAVLGLFSDGGFTALFLLGIGLYFYGSTRKD